MTAVQGKWKLPLACRWLLQALELLWATCAGSNVQHILPSPEACPLHKLLCDRKMPLNGLTVILACAAPCIEHLRNTLGEAHRIKDPQWLLLGAHGR